MTKRARARKQTETRQTNWVLIGGVIAVGVIALFALLFFSLQGPEQVTLAGYCADNPDNCVSRGEASAPVTIVEISDFGCSHCRDFHAETFSPLQQQYVETGQVQWVALPYALSATTLPASNAAMCANEQDAYFAFGEALFAQQGQAIALTRDGFVQAAEQVGLEMEPFLQCVEEGRYNAVINDNVTAARENRVSATPTFFIEDRILEGAYPLSVFQQRIETALN
ncbi:MAG: DsbA family protein [Anaerolineales bacterium]|nr:DsbA family protein [Anaerolineales bacterium]